MKRLKIAYSAITIFIFGTLKLLFSPKKLQSHILYLRDFCVLLRQQSSSTENFPLGKAYPCLNDRYAESGVGNGHYFHQDLLVARRIHDCNPTLHIDVGSRIDGFVAHVASFRILQVIDIRPLTSNIHNVIFSQADIMGIIPNNLKNYCDSLSCLHALEHFGLGRYGDSVCADGHRVGFNNLCEIIRPNGKFYCSVPIGPQRIEFNAHRVFSIQYLIALFSDRFSIDSFSFVDDNGDLHENVMFTEKDVITNFGCIYGCGIFEMTKRQ
ncbi:MAG: DUF268 domain-containing protein [Deltaproteobacteria bacterium]